MKNIFTKRIPVFVLTTGLVVKLLTGCSGEKEKEFLEYMHSGELEKGVQVETFYDKGFPFSKDYFYIYTKTVNSKTGREDVCLYKDIGPDNLLDEVCYGPFGEGCIQRDVFPDKKKIKEEQQNYSSLLFKIGQKNSKK